MDLSLGGKTATDKDISYLASDLSSDPVLGGKMRRKAKVMRSVPQIYVNNAHLGVSSNCMQCSNPANLKNY